MPNAVIRKQFPGGAVATTITSNMTPTSTGVDIAATTGWPTGPTPWVVTINRGGATEEQILVDSRTGTTLAFLLANRGYGATTAQSHNAGESIECSIDPTTIDQVNRFVALPTTVGQMAVFDGTNLQFLSAPATDQILVGDTTEPLGVEWVSRWVSVLASAPAVTSANGQMYYDTTRNELMTTVAGVFKSASMGVVVFANSAARDALFGAGSTAGRLAWVVADQQLYIGTGAEWQSFPLAGEFVVHYANEAAMIAGGLGQGSLAMTDDDTQLWLKRASAWYPVGVHFFGSSPPDPGDVADGDIWGEPI